MKIATIVGARPQFVKSAALSRMVRDYSDIQEVIIHTGQHYDKNMSEIFFTELDIPIPKYNLNIGSGSHAEQTGKMMIEIEKILLFEKPDFVLVYGDTNSTIAASLTAAKLLINIVHVEAGLRSFNRNMPEEQNRILTDHLSNILCCPTQTAINNLANEGLFDGKLQKTIDNVPLRVKNTGDIMFDAILFYQKFAFEKSTILEQLQLLPNSYLLSTIHRPENTKSISKMLSIFEAYIQINQLIILCLHPGTKKYIESYGLEIPKNVRIIEPIGYLDMIQLQNNSKWILTDSGGIQKEAFFLKKPCITLREETEWIETINDDWNWVTGADSHNIISAYNKLQNIDFSNKIQNHYFGDGNAANKILNILANY